MNDEAWFRDIDLKTECYIPKGHEFAWMEIRFYRRDPTCGSFSDAGRGKVNELKSEQ